MISINRSGIASVYRNLLFAALILTHLLFSYNFFQGWWYSALGTIIILLFSYLIWGNAFLSVIGLDLTPVKVILSLAMLLGVVSVSALLIVYTGHKAGLLFGSGSFPSYFHQAFYILNEEILIGSLPIYLMMRKLRLNKWITAASLALLFSLVHFVFYLWVFDHRGYLQVTTLLSLFLVGFFRNALIIRTGHIGFSWALHFGWMAVMFGTFPYYPDGTGLREPDSFNLFLGSWSMVLIAALLVISIVSRFHINRKFSILVNP